MGWLVWAGLFLLSTALSIVLRPKPPASNYQAPKPAGIDEFNFPTAEVGRPVPVLFGTRWISGPNVVWYGDLGITTLTENVASGKTWYGRTKYSTVVTGYRYHVGMHMALCHGPIDELRAIEIGGYLAWAGDGQKLRNVATDPLMADGSSTVTRGMWTYTLEGSALGIRLKGSHSLASYTGPWINTLNPGSVSALVQGMAPAIVIIAGTIYFMDRYLTEEITSPDSGHTSTVWAYEHGARLDLVNPADGMLSTVNENGYLALELNEDFQMRLVAENEGDWVDYTVTCSGYFKDGVCYTESSGLDTYDQNRELIIAQPDLFGGDSKEGGVEGYIDLMFGAFDQERNAYLQGQLGGTIPAFRGVTSVVLKKPYIGISPYLKPWAFMGGHWIHNIDWLESIAPIRKLDIGHNTSLFFSIDRSGSMAWGQTDYPATPSRLDMAKAAMSDVLDIISEKISIGITGIDIMVVAWSDTRTSITRTDCSVSDIEDIRDWIYGRTAFGGTNFSLGVTDAPGFFSSSVPRTNLLFFITDGEPTPASTADTAVALVSDILDKSSSPYSSGEGTAVDMYGINILMTDTTYTVMLDNTPDDGVPVVDATDSSGLTEAILNAFTVPGPADMNAAHIVRACILNTDWGMGYTEDDIDDDSFTDAAETLYAENFGISLLWDSAVDIEGFIETVLSHIDAVLYVDPESGKFVLTLLREDYDAGSLAVIGPDDIHEVESFHRRDLGDLINTVTIKYRVRLSGDLSQSELSERLGEVGVVGDRDASITLHNMGRINQMGEVVSTELNFPGISRNDIANKVAARELLKLSSEVSAVTFTGKRVVRFLRPGMVFKFSWPEYGIAEEIMRVHEINFGTPTDGKIRVQAVQDVTGAPESLYSDPTTTSWTDPANPPAAADDVLLIEAPYWHWVDQYGMDSVVWDEIPDDAGQIRACVARPSGTALDYGIHARVSPDDYESYGRGQFTPHAKLAVAIGKTETTLSISDDVDLNSVTVGGYAYLENEIVGVVSIDTDEDEVVVTRGILDTVPQGHDAGTIIWFANGWEATADEYDCEDAVDVKVTPRNTRGEISIALAPAETVTMNRRMLRPYPPGNFLLDGEQYPESLSGNFDITWAHRDRLTQVTEFVAQDAADIGPEIGTTYSVLIKKGESTLVSETDIAGTTLNVIASSLYPGNLTVTLWSVRDGHASYQAHEHTFAFSSLRITEDGTPRVTEAGLMRIT